MAEYPQSRADRLATSLDDFIRSSPDVEAAAVVSFDGLTMASALPEDLEEDRLGAMSAALLSLGEQAALGLGRGQLNQVFVEGEHGFVFLMSARDQAVLAAIARRTAKIGFMLYEMRRAADRIGTILTPEVEPEKAAGSWAALGGLDDEPTKGADETSAHAVNGVGGSTAGNGQVDHETAEAPGSPPSPWAAPAPPPAPDGWHEEETSALFGPRHEPSQSASGAAWSS